MREMPIRLVFTFFYLFSDLLGVGGELAVFLFLVTRCTTCSVRLLADVNIDLGLGLLNQGSGFAFLQRKLGVVLRKDSSK